MTRCPNQAASVDAPTRVCREEQHLEVPNWHKQVLDERERLLAEGKAQFLDWEEAKRRIDEATQ